MVTLKDLQVKSGKGKGTPLKVIGSVKGYQLENVKDLNDLLNDVKTLVSNGIEINTIVNCLNYGLAVRARQSLHRPENKIQQAKRQLIIKVHKLLPADQIAQIVGLPEYEVNRIIREYEEETKTEFKETETEEDNEDKLTL